jgi:hypothetical protein
MKTSQAEENSLFSTRQQAETEVGSPSQPNGIWEWDILRDGLHNFVDKDTVIVGHNFARFNGEHDVQVQAIAISSSEL